MCAAGRDQRAENERGLSNKIAEIDEDKNKGERSSEVEFEGKTGKVKSKGKIRWERRYGEVVGGRTFYRGLAVWEHSKS